jgi:hypothetical protein
MSDGSAGRPGGIAGRRNGNIADRERHHPDITSRY